MLLYQDVCLSFFFTGAIAAQVQIHLHECAPQQEYLSSHRAAITLIVARAV